MLQNYFEVAVLLATANVINGGVNMTSRLTPYQVTFGDDGRLRMDDFEKKTPCGHAPTKLHDIPQWPCATLATTSNNIHFIPVDGTTLSFPVNMDFTVNSSASNLIEMRFMEGNKEIYVVKFKRDHGIEIEGSSAPLDIQFDESHRFWVTYENGEVKVGLHGNDEPWVEYTDPDYVTNGVDGIELYSKGTAQTEWKFYEPCTISA